MKKLLILIFLSFNFIIHANTLIVTNSNDSGVGSLRFIINLANNNDTIRFSPNLIASGSNQINLLSEITFSKNLKIIGLLNSQDTLFITTSNNIDLFNISNSQYISFDSIVMKNSINAIKLGYVDSLNMKNSILRNNKTGIKSIINTGHIDVSNSKINNNWTGIAIESPNYLVNVSQLKSKIKLDNCEISHNQNFGISVDIYVCNYMPPLSKSLIDVYDSKFIENQYSAIFTDIGNNHTNGSSISEILVDNSYFFHNGYHSSNYGGGAIGNRASNLQFSTGISISKVLVQNSSLIKNTADYGGAIYSSNTSASTNAESITNIINSTIVDNTAGYGGAIFTNCYMSGEIEIVNSTIAKNPDGNGNNNISCYSAFPLVKVISSIMGFSQGNTIDFPLSSNLVSQGYNIFSDSTLWGSLSSDQLGITDSLLNLSPIGIYGNTTIPTVPPQHPSVAIDNGNPLDLGNAQNGAINGIRDVGASEACQPTSSIDIQVACDSYTWMDGITYTTSNNTATYTLANASGCDSIISLDLTINAVSDISISQNQNTLTANNTNATYQWLDCNNNYTPITNETSVSFTASTSGNYAVELTELGCVDTSACMLINNVGINEPNPNLGFELYPTPATNFLNISIYSISQAVHDVTIFDTKGSRLIDLKLKNGDQTIDISSLKPGIFIIQIDNQYAKFIKE